MSFYNNIYVKRLNIARMAEIACINRSSAYYKSTQECKIYSFKAQ